MNNEIDDAILTLKNLQDHLDPDKVGGIDPELTLTTAQLNEIKEAIEQLKDEKNSISEQNAAFDKVDIAGIEALLDNAAVEKFASFNRQAVYDANFESNDVGDEEMLVGQQEAADNYAQEAFEEHAYQAKEHLTALHKKIKIAIESLDEVI